MILQSDTLLADSTRLAYWQSNPLYDYNRELQMPDWDLFLWLRMQLAKLLSKIFGSRFADQYTGIILVVLFVVLVLLLVWFVYRRRPELFTRSGKKALPYTVSEDTIYGIDFEAEIAAALDRGDYREASRLLYLQTLKMLSDNAIIDWQIHKTPTQYVYEVRVEARREPFRQLTNRFMRVRYGNYDATARSFDDMRQLQAEVAKGGEA